MPYRFDQLVRLLITATVVAGLGLSAYASSGPIGVYGGSMGDCCCQPEPACDAEPSPAHLDNDCCPEPGESDEGPCSCACSSCGVMARTVNLYAADVLVAPLFADCPQRVSVMLDRRSASAVLGVDIQPPIA